MDDRDGSHVEATITGPEQAVAVVEELASRRLLTTAQLLMRSELSRETSRQWARRGLGGLRLVTLVALVAGLDGDMAVCPTGSAAPPWWQAAGVHPGWDDEDRRGEAALRLLIPPLRDAAATAGMNQPALARATGLSYMTVVRLFHSATYPQERPRLTTYLAVCGCLGLELRVRARRGRPSRPGRGASAAPG